MTRAQIEAEYQHTHGVIRSPGKFESEPVYAPYFWEWQGNGAETLYDGDRPVDVFLVDGEVRASFPELAEVHAVLLWEDDQGFVHTREVTARQLEAYRAELYTEDDEQADPNG